MNDKIDFVITWVDGNDPKWQKEKAKYCPSKNSDSRSIRYRDWENLRYWFRGVEKFAPWVNKIHFVTWGHIPEWLNTNHPKLNIVKHEDFIPKKYLPTFNCNPLEVNLHRIKGLSEQFVYFNDDMFILGPVSEENFFSNGKPKETAVLNGPVGRDYTYYSIVDNDIRLINKYFSKNDIKNNLKNFVNLKYGFRNLRTLLAMPWQRIIGFQETHHATPLLKSTYKKIWQLEGEKLEQTTSHKFRSEDDYNQYLFKYWQFCDGEFAPTKNKKKSITPLDENTDIKKSIKPKKYPLINFNDSEGNRDFEATKQAVLDILDKILPDKSSFEKYNSRG